MVSPHILLGILGLAAMVACAESPNDGGAPIASPPTSVTIVDQDGSYPTDEVVAAIAASLDDDDIENALTFTPDEAVCVAERWVDAHGVDRMVELGVLEAESPTQLAWTMEERVATFEALEQCVDLVAQLAALFAQDPSLSADQARCVASEYATSEVFVDALFSTAPDPALDARVDIELGSAYETCT